MAVANAKELDQFLRSVERKAFLRARYQVRDEEAALDIVQDAMFKLAESYHEKPIEELTLLFQRILSNTILDWFRRQKTQRSVLVNMSHIEASAEDESFDLLSTLASPNEQADADQADTQLEQKQILALLETEIDKLPARQREAFMMRYWQEMDVAETAEAMGCSEGSVKTHCSRATHTLAKALHAKGIKL